jgi:hypothetical protein
VALGLCALIAVPTPSSAVPSPTDDPSTVDLGTLTPRAQDAVDDRPGIYDNGCHDGPGQVDPRLCRYGDGEARRVMVALGDSHMAQWFTALNRFASRDGYRLLWATKSACPAPSVRLRSHQTGEPYRNCTQWRRTLLEKVAALPRVDLVVTSSSHWHTLLYPGSNTAITSSTDRVEAWRRGLRATVRSLGPTADRVLILRDSPNFHQDVPSCLLNTGGDADACSVAPSKAFREALWRVERKLASSVSRVRTVQVTAALCVDTSCRPVTDSMVLRYRDEAHLTDTFVRTMSPYLSAAVRLAAA